ncbi:MAG: sulfite exporter TauE/SafE family protein [Pleurocapsa minor GSE-CHR-MK-17-07R]|jgi:uncharacterized membrane protein YfcA|nr:sulfite exporter TauE/SafE family protein [Pleurocapsa minor GSE-CHR-MK 17-07R]
MEIGLLILGLAAGVLSGMFGIGGGVVIVPVMTALFGYSLQAAVGTSLAALLMPVGIFACIAYYRAGKLRLKVAALVALGLTVGALGGAQLALNLPTDTLRQLYGAFLLFAAWRFTEPIKWVQERRGQRAPAAESVASTDFQPLPLLIVGLVAGVISGMFGVGGGIVIVPALVGLLKFDQKLAVGTSLGALLLPVSAGAVISYYSEGLLNIGAAALVAIGLAGGAFLGARIALGLPGATIKRLYGIFLLVVGLRFLLGG